MTHTKFEISSFFQKFFFLVILVILIGTRLACSFDLIFFFAKRDISSAISISFKTPVATGADYCRRYNDP